MRLEQLSLFSQSTSSCSSIRYADLQQIATPYMDFSSNDYVLGNYDDKLSLDCEECLVLEQLGDIPLAISNNSLTENSLQEKLYEQQGHTTLMLLMNLMWWRPHLKRSLMFNHHTSKKIAVKLFLITYLW